MTKLNSIRKSQHEGYQVHCSNTINFLWHWKSGERIFSGRLPNLKDSNFDLSNPQTPSQTLQKRPSMLHTVHFGIKDRHNVVYKKVQKEFSVWRKSVGMVWTHIPMYTTTSQSWPDVKQFGFVISTNSHLFELKIIKQIELKQINLPYLNSR